MERGFRLVSPQAERARNSLAERNRQNFGDGDEADESKELPKEEFVDFFTSLEPGDKWWTAKTESGDLVEPGSLNDFPTLDELMMKESQF